jgi:hypothetical protein
MPQIFVCKGCDVTCYYSTSGDSIESDDIRCPKRMSNIKAPWTEIKEVE